MKELFVLGDSISLHYRPYLAAMVRGVYASTVNAKEAALAEADLDNPMGINAGDSGRALERLRSFCDTGLLAYDVITVNCGLHDIKRDRETGAYQVPIERYRENLAQIAALLLAQPGKPYWVRTTPVEDTRHNARAEFHRYAADVDAYNAAADEIIQGAGIPLIDLHGFTENLEGERFIDHVHFDERVRALQAAFIAGHIWQG